MAECVIVFAKNPVPSEVKTRLIPFLSADQAASLYKAFLIDWCDALSTLTVHRESEVRREGEAPRWSGAGSAEPREDKGSGEVFETSVNVAPLPRACNVGTDSFRAKYRKSESMSSLGTKLLQP